MDQKSKDKKRRPLPRLLEFQGIRRWGLEQYRRKVRRIYDGPAGHVLPWGSILSLHEPLVGHLLRAKKFDVSRFHDILDVGSGAGQILRHLLKVARPDARLVACDLSTQMLRRARQRLKSDRPEFITADITSLPFPDESFDCVTCGWVLEHLPDPRPGLAEMARVLRPGGSILILATEATLSGVIVSRTWKCRTYSRDELREACSDVGLTWREQMWFTRFHELFKMGGILVEATRCNGTTPTPASADRGGIEQDQDRQSRERDQEHGKANGPTLQPSSNGSKTDASPTTISTANP
ncbi:MAG: class I SAM-dependent methyltransferase [Planctomycetes bacterium]|nr:class I SAM-dependent methyltransferase [Planctomycetota bacterium]